MEDTHIAIKELIPIVVAAAVWGEGWSGKSVRFQSDNTAVVVGVNSGASRDQEIMQLLRCLSFIIAKYNLVVSANHIKGIDNDLADALSRDKVHHFKSHYVQADPQPTESLINLLMQSKHNWTSGAWTRTWAAIFDKP